VKKEKKKKWKEREGERPKRNIKNEYVFVNSIAPHVKLHYSQVQDKSILHF